MSTIKYDFKTAYPGPQGPHLRCVTNFTRTRKDEDRKGLSIHPRNWNKPGREPKREVTS